MAREGSLQNVKIDGFVICFKFDVCIADYRGCFLSLHHRYYINADGVTYPRFVQKFEINGKPPRDFDEIAQCVWKHGDLMTMEPFMFKRQTRVIEGVHRLAIRPGLKRRRAGPSL